MTFSEWLARQVAEEGHEGITGDEVNLRINGLTNVELLDYFAMYQHSGAKL